MRLFDAGVDVRFTEYMYYPHSFLNFCFPVPKLMCSCSKQAINRVCYWMNEGIYGKAEEAKVDFQEEEQLANDFKQNGLPELDDEHINEILNSKIDSSPKEEEKKELSESDSDN